MLVHLEIPITNGQLEEDFLPLQLDQATKMQQLKHFLPTFHNHHQNTSMQQTEHIPIFLHQAQEF